MNKTVFFLSWSLRYLLKIGTNPLRTDPHYSLRQLVYHIVALFVLQWLPILCMSLVLGLSSGSMWTSHSECIFVSVILFLTWSSVNLLNGNYVQIWDGELPCVQNVIMQHIFPRFIWRFLEIPWCFPDVTPWAPSSNYFVHSSLCLVLMFCLMLIISLKVSEVVLANFTSRLDELSLMAALIDLIEFEPDFARLSRFMIFCEFFCFSCGSCQLFA